MSLSKKLLKAIQNLYQQMVKLSRALTKKLMNWLLRGLIVLGQRSRLARAGFILPTVTMVVLVVVLLTTAIVFRSFDRTKNASNFRVSEVALNAATPALDRARAKIDRLFSAEESELQGNTPPEGNIATVLSRPRYTFGDETRLRVVTNNPADGQLDSAWKFPVDTDNNGQFDSFTLYGIYFRNPPLDAQGRTRRARNPLEARALPMDQGTLQGCAAIPGGEVGWFETGGELKKAFFTYVATVPITDQNDIDAVPADQRANYELYTGNKGFSALEMQQDQARVALDNNAVWYEDDLEIGNLTDPFRLNGRVHTNGNLLVRSRSDQSPPIRFYQVSSRYSCFYKPENAKIVVGGNVADGDIRTNNEAAANEAVVIDLFRGRDTDPPTGITIGNTNKTTTLAGAAVASNNTAFDGRISLMVRAALSLVSNDPAVIKTITPDQVANIDRFQEGNETEIVDEFKEKYNADAPDSNLLEKVLTTYFKRRTRRVSYQEVPYLPAPDNAYGWDGYTDATVLGSTDPIRPPDDWMRIANSTGSVNGFSELPLRIGAANAQPMDLEQTNPKSINPEGFEEQIGDRISVGNNLPYRWLKDDNTVAEVAEKQPIVNGGNPVNWNKADGSADAEQRERQSQIQELDDLGDTSRGGFWEQAAARTENFNDEELAGGLRVITGAGIYIDGQAVGANGTGQRGTESFLPEPHIVFGLVDENALIDEVKDRMDVIYPDNIYPDINPDDLLGDDPIVVWPDTMPMYDKWNDANSNGVVDVGEELKGDLQMRATVVYHHAVAAGGDALPIACISSYYDPTSQYTRNNVSNNGISYEFPGRDDADARLANQARLVFPNGRFANKPLFDALQKAADDRSVADWAAIDAANCALAILDETAVAGSPVPNQAIKESAFLDGRQVKALHKPNEDAAGNAIPDNTVLADITNPARLQIAEPGQLTTQYDLPIEQRQPLEIRVTDIDIKAIRKVDIGSDKLLPFSGIVYASRDDAMPDISDPDGPLSPTDFMLDPTRRPNGIRLINGPTLARTDNNQNITDERGLILVSDLPVYIKGDFNLHVAPGVGGAARQEFTTTLATNYSNFYTRGQGAEANNYNRNPNFACREANACDMWRPARILSDAITLLSDSFRDGFRNEGDYDLNNNIGNGAVAARLNQGFWSNGYVTNADWDVNEPGWADAANNGLPRDFDIDAAVVARGSSYLMNGVTPVQRRVPFPEYIMEICREPLVSQCNAPDKWVVGYDINGDGDLDDPNERNVRASGLGQVLSATVGKAAGVDNILQSGEVGWNVKYITNGNDKSPLERLGAGTTARPALDPDDQRYPRRVAFARDGMNNLLPAGGPFQPLGVGCPLDTNANGANNGCIYGGNAVNINIGQPANNALWFWTTTDTTAPINPAAIADRRLANDQPLFYLPPPSGNLQDQPLLVPVLQHHVPTSVTVPANFGVNAATPLPNTDIPQPAWFQTPAAPTTFNAVFVMGDSPSRPGAEDPPPNRNDRLAESGGGLPNFPRFLESWAGQEARIQGSFIQAKKSLFATAPFTPIDNSGTDTSLFFDLPVYRLQTNDDYRYRGGASRRRSPYYTAPSRAWGYDVGLLSQTPDLFSKRFATPTAGRPFEFYREVSRDDQWIQPLLCAAQDPDRDGNYDKRAVNVNTTNNCPPLGQY